jgi:hypothetical protein
MQSYRDPANIPDYFVEKKKEKKVSAPMINKTKGMLFAHISAAFIAAAGFGGGYLTRKLPEGHASIESVAFATAMLLLALVWGLMSGFSFTAKGT